MALVKLELVGNEDLSELSVLVASSELVVSGLDVTVPGCVVDFVVVVDCNGTALVDVWLGIVCIDSELSELTPLVDVDPVVVLDLLTVSEDNDLEELTTERVVVVIDPLLDCDGDELSLSEADVETE